MSKMQFRRLHGGVKMRTKRIGYIGTKKVVVLFHCPWCGCNMTTFYASDEKQPVNVKKCSQCENLYFSTYDYDEKEE